jgi:hypothetical protein
MSEPQTYDEYQPMLVRVKAMEEQVKDLVAACARREARIQVLERTLREALGVVEWCERVEALLEPKP